MDADLKTAIGCVVFACLARLALDKGRPVTRTQLAALASVSVPLIGKRVGDGTLRTSRGRVTAESAIRWLADRGITI